ncbi:MAG: pyrimidine 5'-nucleotidase, partial [Paracoccaceae bacterium]|nr:pyrimidine 5'-nucleotidase [Paracoccaceae bacterium]
VFAKDGFSRQTAAMFEDDPRNLQVPHAMGLKTILISELPNSSPFIDHQAPDLSDFLAQLLL